MNRPNYPIWTSKTTNTQTTLSVSGWYLTIIWKLLQIAVPLWLGVAIEVAVRWLYGG